MLTAKELAKLAKACRKSGIKTYKGEGFEITLSDEIPTAKESKSSKKTTSAATPEEPGLVETDDMTEEQLLFWSSPTMPNEKTDS